jgi:hypothetical protein
VNLKAGFLEENSKLLSRLIVLVVSIEVCTVALSVRSLKRCTVYKRSGKQKLFPCDCAVVDSSSPWTTEWNSWN